MSVQFYAFNQVKLANITALNVDAQFPLSNLKDDRRTKVVRSTTNTLDVVFDFLEPVQIDGCLIVDAKLREFGFTSATFELNTSDSWVTPPVSVPMTINGDEGIAKSILTSTETYRFARVSLSIPSGTIELSKVFIGQKIELVDNCFTYPITYRQTNRAAESVNRYFQRFFDEIVTQKGFNASINTMTKDEFDQVLQFVDYNSTTIPLFINFDGIDGLNDPDRLGGMYYIEDQPSMQLVPGNYWNITLNFTEAT
jgi:hypothetical protein